MSNICGVRAERFAFEERLPDEVVAPSNDEKSDSLPAEDAVPGTSLLLLEGDIGAQVAALAIRSAQTQRETNRDRQVAEEAALERAEDAQVAALHQKAADIRMAGLIDGACGMGSGLFTMAGGIADSPIDKEIYKGAATTSEVAGKALGSLPKAAQADDDGNAAQSEHEAAHHRRNLDAARDAVREGQDLLERALDFYKQNQQGAADAVNSSVRRG